MNRSTKSLILNVIFPSLFVGGIAGVYLGYWMAKPGQISGIATVEAKLQAENRAPSLPNVSVSPSPNPSEITTTASSAETSKVQIGGTADTSDASYLAPTDEQIEKMGDKNWVQGSVQSREVDEKTREAYTVETLPDGSRADRTYREDGSLKGESVTYDNGTNLSRNFFESGGVKVAYVKRADGSATSMLYDSTGVPTQQTTQFKNGTQIYKEYNDHGIVTGTYKASPDGTTEPLDAP
jgi:hypothetical protein